MENSRSSTRWTDEQLEAILNEVGYWVLNGKQGQVLCFAASLRHAIDRATQYALSGAVVTTACRLPSDKIVVFAGQTDWLRSIIAIREVAPTAAA